MHSVATFAQNGATTGLLGPLTRRPAVMVALLLALGIFLHDHVPFHPHGNWLISACVVLIAALFLRRRIVGAICISLSIVLLGVLLAQREHYEFSSNDIANFANDEPRLTELQATVLDDPKITVGPATGRQLPPKMTATVSVQRIKSLNGWIDSTGELPVLVDQIQPELSAGETVQMLGMLQRPRAAMNPGEFDWAAYYRQQRVLATFTVTRAGNVRVIANRGPGWIGWLRSGARENLAMGFSAARATDFALLDALVLGERDPQLKNIQQQFQDAGVEYQLTVSGLHVAILAATVFWLCRLCLLSPLKTLLITTCFVVLYVAISQPSHSGIRAAILSVIAAIALCSGRSFDRAQVLSLAVIAMLLWHPMDLASAGFQMSLVVVIVYLLLLPPLRMWLRSFRDEDVVARPSPANRTFVQKLCDGTIAWVVRASQYAVLAWLATLPLVAYHFGQATCWSIAGGLLLLPVVIASLFSGVIKILITLLLPRWAEIWAIIAGVPLRVLEWGVHELNRLPGGSITLPAPPIWLILVYYLLLIAPLLQFRFRWLLRLAPIVGVASIFALPFVHAPVQIHPCQLKLTLLSLGAGQCAVVEPPGGPPIIFDAGSSTVSDVARTIVEPFLRAEGDTKIDEIFLSHGDFDHISAAGELASVFEPHDVFTSYHFLKNSAGNLPDQMLLEELDRLGKSPRNIALGDHLELGHGTAVDVLWPPKVGELNSNNAGLVLRLTFAGRSILFPADIQDPALAGVLKNPAELKSDVLIAPHHGSSEELTPAFLSAVHPQMILSSNFNRLTSKQRRFNTMVGQTPLYRTSDYGAITVTIDSDGKISLSAFVKRPSSGR